MRLVRIEIIKGKSTSYKKELLECVHSALIESLGIEDWDGFQRIVEIDREFFETASGNAIHFLFHSFTLRTAPSATPPHVRRRCFFHN